MKIKMKLILTITILLLSGVISACQPKPKVTSEGDYTLQVTQIDTTNFPLVDVYISVQDTNGEPKVVNTGKIQLLENGEPVSNQRIKGTGEVGPLTTLLLIDNSGSMNYADKLTSAKEVAKEYLNQMRAEDQAGLITFNTEVKTVQEITANRNALEKAIDGISANSDTAMFDALVTAVETLNPLPGRKAIIVLTDGMDNQSAADADDALSSIGFSGLSISTVGFGQIPEGGEEADEYSGIDESTLRYIAENAGGRYGYVENKEELSILYDQMRRSLQSEVVISYETLLTLRDGVLRALTATLSDRYHGVGGESQTSFNPGGLVPEVALPASWTTFAIILAILAVLLIVPVVILMIRNKKPRKKKIRIKLKD